MPDISELIIKINSNGVVTANGNLAKFTESSKKAEKSADDLSQKFGAFQLIANKLPGPLKSMASGLMGIVSPATAVVSALMEIGGYSQQCIQAFQDQQVHLARLNVVLESTGAQSWTTTDSLKYMADTIRQETGRSTDEIMRMQAVLLGFTGITGENFHRLTRDLINMADVMGGDLASSANTFGRALESPTKSLNALTRQGFVFTEEQKRIVKQLEELGRLEEAQVIYLEAMENAFGDAAKATRDAKGASVDLTIATDNLRLAFGRLAAESGFKQLIQGGLAKGLDWYAGILEGIANGFNNIHINNAAIAAFDAGIATEEQKLIALYFKIQETDKKLQELETKRRKTAEDNRKQDFLTIEYYSLVSQYDDVAASMKKQRDEQEEINRLLGIQKQLSAEIAKIENAYDDTDEGKATKIERDIAKWIKLRDSMWETSTGEFSPLQEEFRRQIDVIITSLLKTKDGAGKVKHEFEDWVKILAQATGYLAEDIGGKWDENLNKFVGGWGGLNTVEKYANDVQKLQDTLFSQNGDLIKALGLDRLDVVESSANRVRSVLEAMLNSGKWDGTEQSVKSLIEKLEELDEVVLGATFDRDKKKLELQKESIWLSEKELMIRELIAQYGNDSRAKEIYELDRQIEKIEAFRDALNQLKEAGLNLTATGLVDFAHDLGKAFYEGTSASSAFEDAFRNMLKTMIDAMPQMLLNVGLQLMSRNWKLGLAFIGASGLMSFVSGMIDNADQDGRNDEADRLRRIQEQITDLIDAQRQQQEYYMIQKRRVNDSAISVNDAIITPRGRVYTNPEDYIIATKTPETLMGGGNCGNGNVNVIVQNYAQATINTETETAKDGSKLVRITVENIVKNGIANGEFDGAFNAMNNRRGGRSLSN
jgi:hypothetical protein